MTDLEKPKPKSRAKKKPPTQTAGVTGIDGHGGMGEAPIDLPTEAQFQQYINWQKLIALPAFEMFAIDESGHKSDHEVSEWIAARRASMGDEKLYELYASWHEKQGLWVNETPLGNIK